MSKFVQSASERPFARLVPANDAAKQAFHDVALGIRGDGTRITPFHAAKYMSVESFQENGLWTGYFILYFKVPPADPNMGWVLGEGNLSNDIDTSDIVIGPGRRPEDPSRYPLAALTFDQKSGALTIVAPDDVTVTLDIFERIQGCKRCLHKNVTSIEINRKQYKLKLKTIRDRIYRSYLNDYRNLNTEFPEEIPSSLALVPSQTDNVVDRFVVKNVIGGGSTCTVHVGYDRTTGQAVAVKRYIRRNARSFQRECQRLDMIANLGPHPGISQHVATIDPMEQDPTAGYMAFGLDEVYFISNPLANWTLTKILTDDAISVNDNQRLHILRQMLDALAFLHSNNIMHRDIKPDNIAIVSIKPPKACLIDFGHAFRRREAADRDVGTLAWCAPEIWAFHDRTPPKEGYGNKVDLFSMGLCMYQLFCGKAHAWWRERVLEENLSQMKRDINRLSVLGHTKGLLKGLIAFDLKERLDAARVNADIAVWFENAIAETERRIQAAKEQWGQGSSANGEKRAGGNIRGASYPAVQRRGNHAAGAHGAS